MIGAALPCLNALLPADWAAVFNYDPTSPLIFTRFFFWGFFAVVLAVFSVVYKQFVPQIGSNFGITYTYTSGRPYFDAANPVFLGDRTKAFTNVSIAASHIRAIKGSFLVFFLTIDNVLGRRNEFGFRYSSDGQSRFPVIPVAYRTLFFGVSMNISRNAEVPKEGKLDL